MADEQRDDPSELQRLAYVAARRDRIVTTLIQIREDNLLAASLARRPPGELEEPREQLDQRLRPFFQPSLLAL